MVGGDVSIIPRMGSWKDGKSVEKNGEICGDALMLSLMGAMLALHAFVSIFYRGMLSS